MKADARGWTIPEALVGMALLSVVMLVVTMVMLSTSRITRRQSQQSLQQTRLQVVAAKLESALLGCSPRGVSWLRSSAPDAAILATHPFRSDRFTLPQPRWETLWRCFVWDVTRRRLYFMPTPVPGAAPSDVRCEAMTPGQMGAFLPVALAAPDSRLLSDRVTHFAYALEPGPLFRIELEIDVPTYDGQGQTASRKLEVTRLINPRNQD